MTVTLHLGDCLQIMPTLPAGSIDAIITDVPYGATACAWDTVIPFVPMWECVKRVLKPNGVFVTTASQPFTSMLVMSNLEWFKYEWIWEKTAASGFINANRIPMKYHENIIVFGDKQTIYNPQKIKGKRRINGSKGSRAAIYGDFETCYNDNNGKLFPPSIIKISNGHSAGTTDHPTQKPVALYKYLILTYTNSGDTVLDICAGSGTTGVACIETGRNFIGIELKQEYYEIMQKRIEQAQLQMLLPIQV